MAMTPDPLKDLQIQVLQQTIRACEAELSHAQLMLALANTRGPMIQRELVAAQQALTALTEEKPDGPSGN